MEQDQPIQLGPLAALAGIWEGDKGDDVAAGLRGEMVRRIESAGHRAVTRVVVRDDPTLIGLELRRQIADPDVDAVLLNGGTGIAPRDTTVDVVRAFLDRELPGFGEIFRSLSHTRIGAAAMLSRSVGGIAAGKPVFSLPGSPSAVTLGMEELILPELGHLVHELRRSR